jgi:microcystin-dependent protein
LADVQNVGTTSDAVFNFLIPRGDTGAIGPAGSAGWTLTTADFIIPPVGQTITVNVENTDWIAIGQIVYVEDKDTNEAIPMEVTAKTVGTVTLRTPPTYPTSISEDTGNLLATGADSLPYLDSSYVDAGDANLQAQIDTVAVTGEIKMFAGISAPTNWLFCNGSAISRTTYANLFAVVGTTFGAGDGSTTFNLPDFRGRAPIGAGQGSGLTNRALGTQAGAETHILSSTEMPVHTHVQNAHNHVQNSHNHSQDWHNHAQDAHNHGQLEHSHGIKFSDLTYAGGGGTVHNLQSHPGGTGQAASTPTTASCLAATATNQGVVATNQATTATNQAATATNQNAGGDAAHNNMQPSLAINFIIRT